MLGPYLDDELQPWSAYHLSQPVGNSAILAQHAEILALFPIPTNDSAEFSYLSELSFEDTDCLLGPKYNTTCGGEAAWSPEAFILDKLPYFTPKKIKQGSSRCRLWKRSLS